MWGVLEPGSWSLMRFCSRLVLSLLISVLFLSLISGKVSCLLVCFSSRCWVKVGPLMDSINSIHWVSFTVQFFSWQAFLPSSTLSLAPVKWIHPVLTKCNPLDCTKKPFTDEVNRWEHAPGWRNSSQWQGQVEDDASVPLSSFNPTATVVQTKLQNV